MKGSPRVLMVTRRFWPLASDSIYRNLNLAAGLRSMGCPVDVLTASWHSTWPDFVQLRELNVHRLGPSPTTPFRARRFGRTLLDWIAKHESRYDCIIMDSHEEDSLLVANRGSSDLPILLRYDSMDTFGSTGPLVERFRQRNVAALRLAAGIVVPHDHALRELIAMGERADYATVIADGPIQRIERSSITRTAARRALSDINYELFLRSDDRLCVCLTDMVNSANLDFVIRTLGPLCESRRDLRFWILGDGPLRTPIHELLRQEGWKHEILLPGSFESPDVPLAAADLCLVPSALHGASWIMPTAIASGLTTIAVDAPSVRARLGNLAGDLLYSHGDSSAFGRTGASRLLSRRHDRRVDAATERTLISRSSDYRTVAASSAQCYASVTDALNGYRCTDRSRDSSASMAATASFSDCAAMRKFMWPETSGCISM